MPTLASAETTRSTDPVRSLLAGEHDFREVLDEYIATMPAKRSRLRALMADGNLDLLKTEVHQLVGSGGSYGFPGLSDLALETENACKARDSASALKLANDLIDMIGRIRAD